MSTSSTTPAPTTPATTLSPFDRLHGMMEELFPSVTFLRGAWNPAVDIKETDTEYIFIAELPGMNREDFEVELSGDMLSIRGKRDEVKEESKEGYLRKERHYGSFYRSFRIDTPVEADKINAEYNKGVLQIVVPKGETTKAQRIRVK